MTFTANTLGSLIKGGFSLTATCQRRECGHSAGLPLRELAERFGEGEVTVGRDTRFRRRLKCSRCGGRSVALTLHPKDSDVGGFLPR